jgi:hypothetical protein
MKIRRSSIANKGVCNTRLQSSTLLDKLRKSSSVKSGSRNLPVLPGLGGLLPAIPTLEKDEFSLVLNLQPVVKTDSIFEILSNKQGVNPHTLAIDHSPFLAINDISSHFSNSIEHKCIARSIFPDAHGNDSLNRLDNRKVIYYKKTQTPMSFVSSQVHSIELRERDANGIYELEFKVLRDSTYDSVYLNGLPNGENNPANDSFVEADGYVPNLNLLNDILMNSNTVYQKQGELNVPGSVTLDKYQVDYDIITIIFYGCVFDADFDKLYTANQLFGTTKLNNISELTDGLYISKIKSDSDKNEYKVFSFDRDSLSMTDIETNDTFNYDFDSNTFEVSGYELDFDFRSICVDADGKIYQFDKVEESDTYGKYVDNQLQEHTDRDNILEFTNDYANHILDLSVYPNNGIQDSEVEIMNSVLDSLSLTKENSFIKIKFIFREAEFDTFGNMTTSGTTITHPTLINEYKDTSTASYKYPNVQNSEMVLSEKPFNIIYNVKIENEANSYLRDFVMFGKIFQYIESKIESKINIITLSDNTNSVSLFEERRTNPLLWSYLQSIHDMFMTNDHSYLAYTGNKPIHSTFTIGQFLKANYYDLTQATKNTNEAKVLGMYSGVYQFPTIIVAMPL